MANSNEYMREYMKQRRLKRRAAAINQLGGKCVDCGITEDLEFDHVDPSTKEEEVGKLLAGASEKRLQAELAKCVLRCEYHHRKRTNKQISVNHGGGLTGKRNCRCNLCKPLKQAYMEARKQKYYSNRSLKRNGPQTLR